MADCCDNAQDIEELALKSALSARKPAMKACGNCYWCGEECHGCFCDADCAHDHQRASKAKIRNG